MDMNTTSLKAVGLKITEPRIRILELLSDQRSRHHSAEEIYDQMKETDANLSLATIYRVLTQFETAGLVMRHNFEEGHSIYELNEGEHHDHLVCVKCRKVVEFHDGIIEDRQRAIAKERGFQITDHSLNIYGVCKDCLCDSSNS